MNDFPKTAEALRELRVACRQLACANLRSRLMLDELYALLAADFVDGKYTQPTKTSMYPRTNYEMTEADLKKILDACKPVPTIMLQCGKPSSPQENANRAWAELGERMGFDAMTVQLIEGKSHRFFTAVPTENESQMVIL